MNYRALGWMGNNGGGNFRGPSCLGCFVRTYDDIIKASASNFYTKDLVLWQGTGSSAFQLKDGKNYGQDGLLIHNQLHENATVIECEANGFDWTGASQRENHNILNFHWDAGVQRDINFKNLHVDRAVDTFFTLYVGASATLDGLNFENLKLDGVNNWNGVVLAKDGQMSVHFANFQIGGHRVKSLIDSALKLKSYGDIQNAFSFS